MKNITFELSEKARLDQSLSEKVSDFLLKNKIVVADDIKGEFSNFGGKTNKHLTLSEIHEENAERQGLYYRIDVQHEYENKHFVIYGIRKHCHKVAAVRTKNSSLVNRILFSDGTSMSESVLNRAVSNGRAIMFQGMPTDEEMNHAVLNTKKEKRLKIDEIVANIKKSIEGECSCDEIRAILSKTSYYTHISILKNDKIEESEIIKILKHGCFNLPTDIDDLFEIALSRESSAILETLSILIEGKSLKRYLSRLILKDAILLHFGDDFIEKAEMIASSLVEFQ